MLDFIKFVSALTIFLNNRKKLKEMRNEFQLFCNQLGEICLLESLNESLKNALTVRDRNQPPINSSDGLDKY